VKPPTVFISHTTRDSRDHDLAHKLSLGLQERGARVWIAPDSLPVGKEWKEGLVAGVMEKCTHFLVILSAASVRSKWVLNEIQLARRRYGKEPKFRVMPLPTGKLGKYQNHDFLAKFQSVSFSQDFHAQLDTIAEAAHLQLSVPENVRKAVWPPPPQRPGLFVGRDEGLEDLRQRLGVGKNKRPGRKAPTIAMFGLPGIGKTTLAAELTWDEQIRKAFPDGTLWTAVGEASERTILGQWGAVFGRDGEKVAGAISPEAAWIELGKVLSDRRMLLVVDDVWDLSQAGDFKKILSAGCALVVTTRFRRLALDLADEPEKHAYELPELTDEDGLELLRRLAESVVEKYPQKCLKLVKALGRLPLSLQVAGRLLYEENKKDPALAEKSLDELPGKLLDAPAPLDRKGREDKTPPTVAALLKRSTDRLDKTMRERFATLGANPGDNPRPAVFSPDTLKDIWRVRDPQPTIDALINHGLMEPLGNGNYQVHAVLVSFANSLLRRPAKRTKTGRKR